LAHPGGVVGGDGYVALVSVWQAGDSRAGVVVAVGDDHVVADDRCLVGHCFESPAFEVAGEDVDAYFLVGDLISILGDAE